MSTDVEEKSSSKREESPEAKRLPKFSYSKDFLLSLSGLDICKKLPRGFDVSLLSVLEDASNKLEPQRSRGGTSFQKWNEHGPNSISLASSSNYSWGSCGRWNTYSSGSSYREELQSDSDSDYRKRYLNLSCHSWKHSEHDGLLGRPSGYSGQSGQTSAERPHGNSSHQLNRSTEPYQPPWLHKQAHYSQSSTNMSNDETFGTSEAPSHHNAKEEKYRRESFELMRRKQHKSQQEKPQDISIKPKESLDYNFSSLLTNSGNAHFGGNKCSKHHLHSLVSQQNDSRSSIQQAPASRPHVPPGFSTAVEKKLSPSSITSLALEVKFGFDDKHLTKAANGNDDISNEGEITEDCKDIVNNDSTNKKVTKIVNLDEVVNDHPTSILNKLFQTALTRKAGGLSDFIEHQSLKADDEPRSPSLTFPSKLVKFFNQEEKEPARDSFSVEISNDKIGHEASVIIGANSLEKIPSHFQNVNTEASQNFNFTENSVEVRTQGSYHHCTSKPAENSGMLTCEYIEKLMLAEVNLGSSSLQHNLSESWTKLDANSDPQNRHVDDHASHHLFSLLQQGTNMNDSSHLTLVNQETMMLSENFCFTNDTTSYKESGIHDASAEATGAVQSAENSLTLEALFGTAFMKELQSAEAPVSAQRVCGERITASIPDPHDLQFSHIDANSLFPSIRRRGSPNASNGTGLSAYAPETESSNNKEICVDSESLQAADFYLPEEESLIFGNDAMNPGNSELPHLEIEVKNEALLPSNMKDNIVNKLAALNSIPISHLSSLPPGVDGLHPQHGPYDQKNVNPSYERSYGRPSSPFPRQLIGQTRALVRQLDRPACINPLMKFMGPNNVHPDLNHPYPPNMIHHQSLNNVLGSQFDLVSHFQMLQHMQLLGNFPPPKMQDYPRGIPPSHPFDYASMFHDLKQTNPFWLHHHQQGYGGCGMKMPVKIHP